MQRVNEFVFYDLATKLHKLTEIQDGVKFTEVWSDWYDARTAVNDIFKFRPMNFTLSTATSLYSIISEVVPQKWDDIIAKFPKTGEEEPAIPSWTIQRLKAAAQEFETVIRNECQVMDTYFVTKKGAYSTADLVDNAHHQVPNPTRGYLTEQTKGDFDQAGKCMAFDVPTAAAFHLLRGTEVVIREYYELVVPGNKKASIKMRSWGVYIRLLENHGADPNVISLLKHLKDVYRNPVLNPDENYSDEQVQVLFGVCVSAIVLTVGAIQKEKNKSATLQFPITGATALQP